MTNRVALSIPLQSSGLKVLSLLMTNDGSDQKVQRLGGPPYVEVTCTDYENIIVALAIA